MLYTRILTATVLLVVLVGFAWWAPPLVFDLLLLLIAALACYEWLRLLNTSRNASLLTAAAVALGGLFCLLNVSAVVATQHGVGDGLLPVYGLASVLWLVAVPIAIARFAPVAGQGIVGRAIAVASCVAAWLALLQADGLGKGFLLSVLLLIWVADTAAYFVGRQLGIHKLAPAVSPGKTWEGVAGALVANLLMALVLANMNWVSSTNPVGTVFSFLQISMGWGFMLMFVVMITLVSVLGDLYESLIKRVAGVKDSGTLLPGHGGVLDRIDALLAVVPLTMWVVTLIQSGVLS